MDTLLWVIAATLVNGLASLGGVVTLWIKPKIVDRIVLLLVAFSAGALLGGAFFHLLAESIPALGIETCFLIMMAGLSSFFIMERFFHWRHCHEGKCDVHPMTYLVLIGDGIHNFIDGIVIAASFFVSVPFGILTTLLIIGHEIPQELGDFGVLVHGGMDRTKALAYNFLSQLTCVVGGIIGVLIGAAAEPVWLLPFAAGGFIYIATSDLIPELHKEEDLSRSTTHFAMFFLGLLFIIGMKALIGG